MLIDINMERVTIKPRAFRTRKIVDKAYFYMYQRRVSGGQT